MSDDEGEQMDLFVGLLARDLEEQMDLVGDEKTRGLEEQMVATYATFLVASHECWAEFEQQLVIANSWIYRLSSSKYGAQLATKISDWTAHIAIEKSKLAMAEPPEHIGGYEKLFLEVQQTAERLWGEYAEFKDIMEQEEIMTGNGGEQTGNK